MSRFSFALTIVALLGAIAIFSGFVLHSLFASDPGNEDVAEATEEMTQPAESTEETTAIQETTALEETTVQERAGDLDRPPDSTLAYGGQEVRGSLGSYCWGDTCADMAYPVLLPKKTLTVPSGSEMEFRFGGQGAPDRLKIHVTPLDEYGKSVSARADSNLRPLKAFGSGLERTIPVELPPGEYVVDVYVEKSQSLGLGQTDYFFRVMVE